MKPSTARFAALLSPVLLSSLSPAAIITFQDGVSPTSSYDHTALDIRSAGSTNNASNLVVGLQQGGVGNMRGILSFDLSAIPAGSTIDSVSLVLTVSGGGEGSAATVGNVNLHQLTPGGSAANTLVEGQANWTNWQTGSAWNTAGGDFGSILTSTAVTTYTVGTTYTFSSAGLDAVTQSVFDAGSPLQLILISPTAESSGATNFIRFGGDEHTTLAYRPQLVINYTIPEVSSVLLGSLGSLLLLSRRSRG